MSLTPQHGGFRSSSGREGRSWRERRRGAEGIRTSDSHTSGISPRGAIFSPHGNCVRGYSRSRSGEALPEARDGAASVSGPSARPLHSMVNGAGAVLVPSTRAHAHHRSLRRTVAVAHGAVARRTPGQGRLSGSPTSRLQCVGRSGQQWHCDHKIGQ